jgi:DNA topoisomerase IB
MSATTARRLRRSDCSGEGIRRKGSGRGFFYLDAAGRRIEDGDTLERLHQLAIPPAWKEVWICPDPMGHIQATGIDAAGRKQYLYHDRWRLDLLADAGLADREQAWRWLDRPIRNAYSNSGRTENS